MHSLKDKFDEVCLRLGQGRRLESTGSDPVFYLVFPVSEILKVKQHTKSWVAKLEIQGWSVVTFSMAETVNDILRGHRLRRQWLLGEKMLLSQAETSGSPLQLGEINKTLSKALTEGSDLVDRLKAKIEEAAARPSGLLLLTDLEALHPYLRINSLEVHLRGCPVVALYPGKREGKTSLRFVEFYPADPNYRSEHIG